MDGKDDNIEHIPTVEKPFFLPDYPGSRDNSDLFPAAGKADDDIALAIEQRILQDPGVNLNNIDVTVDNGIVTLSGRVDNLLAEDSAVNAARTVRGVRSVVETITVIPSSRLDDQIRADISRKFRYDPVIESRELEVSVQNGRVRLTGIVDSWQERVLAGRLVKGIDGVVDLNNRIIIHYATERPDREIAEEIDRRLYWDALVDDALIEIRVEDGIAALEGTVGAAERQRPFANAWVAGV